jgi:hypothetical protein
MKEKSDEDLEDQNKIEIIGVDHTIVLEEASINLMSQQVMKEFKNHDYIISRPLDYGLDKFVTSKENLLI